MKKKRIEEKNKNLYYFLILLIILINLFLIYQKVGYYLLPSPGFPEMSMERALQIEAETDELVEVNLKLSISDVSDLDSVLIIEQIPLEFEILSISPEPLFFYKAEGMIVWGGRNYVPEEISNYTYQIKSSIEGDYLLNGETGVLLNSGEETYFYTSGNSQIIVKTSSEDDSDDGSDSGDSGSGGGVGGGSGGGSGDSGTGNVSERDLTDINTSDDETEVDDESGKISEIDEEFPLDEYRSNLIYIVLGIILLVSVLTTIIIILIKQKREEREQ